MRKRHSIRKAAAGEDPAGENSRSHQNFIKTRQIQSQPSNIQSHIRKILLKPDKINHNQAIFNHIYESKNFIKTRQHQSTPIIIQSYLRKSLLKPSKINHIQASFNHIYEKNVLKPYKINQVQATFNHIATKVY